METIFKRWWLLLLNGILFLILGVISLAYPVTALFSVAVYIGVVALVAGIGSIVVALSNMRIRGWGWRLLGRGFIAYSLIATVGFSLPYKLYELFPPLWPQLAEKPLLAAVVGALFVGVGAGLSVRAGGASGGDDALAMCIAHVTGMGIQWAYLSTDLVVLGLSLTYIPLRRIGYSLLTVLISGQLIGLVQRLPLPWDRAQPETME